MPTLVLALLILLSPLASAAPPGIEASVVRILNHSQRGDWQTPWTARPARRSSGSGFVIDGGQVLTNAHVVSDARMLLLYLNDDPVPHEARVVAIGHDCDLALLEPVQPDLLAGVPPLELGEAPGIGQQVETWGYPSGGKRLSSTRGVVSRIEMRGYVHSGVDAHLAVQTDAAINPGNSGGPVVHQGRAVGVAFQGIGSLDNVGFFIPDEVVRHFLQDAADGEYHGYPELGIQVANLENPAARARVGMSREQSGVLVDRVIPDSSAQGWLEPGDVLLSVDEHPIANDGTFSHDGLRLHLGVLLDRHQQGDLVHMAVLRQGQPLQLEIPLTRPAPQRARGRIYDRLPRYYVYAGLVFVPLDRGLMETYGTSWSTKANKRLLYEFWFRELEQPERAGQERVVLLRRLDHPVNANMAFHSDLVVEQVNGHTIGNLEELVAAIEGNEEPYHVLEFAWHGRFAVLDRAQAEQAHPEILERYAVPADRRL